MDALTPASCSGTRRCTAVKVVFSWARGVPDGVLYQRAGGLWALPYPGWDAADRFAAGTAVAVPPSSNLKCVVMPSPSAKQCPD